MGIENKTVGVIGRLQNNTRSGGCGCVATGCAIVMLLFFVMCIGSYFVTMHTSLPLALIESALESDGNIEVEGLRGSISTGFEIDSLKFESDECDEWNELRDIRFSYNGFFNLLRTKRLLIYEASVGSATIYARIDGENDIELGDAFNGEDIAREIAEEWADMQNEFSDNDAEDLRELRIDLVSAKNVAIVDPDSGTRLEFNKVEFKNYQVLDGQITRIGDLEIISDQIDLKSGKSERYADESIAWNFIGNVKPSAHHTIIKDISFDIDFAIVSTDEIQLHVNLFDESVEIDEPYGALRKIALNDFSHGDYFELHSDLLPSHWQVNMTIVSSEPEIEQEQEPVQNDAAVDQPEPDEIAEDESATEEPETPEQESASEEADQDDAESDENDSIVNESRNFAINQRATKKNYSIEIDPGSSFLLGEARFEIETQQVSLGSDEQMEPPLVVARAELDGKTIMAHLTLKRSSPWFEIALQSDGEEPNDLWSRLFFQNDYKDLDDEQQLEVDKAIQGTISLPDFDDIEPVDF